jgi:hypothetical protein
MVDRFVGVHTDVHTDPLQAERTLSEDRLFHGSSPQTDITICDGCDDRDTRIHGRAPSWMNRENLPARRMVEVERKGGCPGMPELSRAPSPGITFLP